jgi:hypothetical protein
MSDFNRIGYVVDSYDGETEQSHSTSVGDYNEAEIRNHIFQHSGITEE